MHVHSSGRASLRSVRLLIDGQEREVMIDTGATICAIPETMLPPGAEVRAEGTVMRGVGGLTQAIGRITLRLDWQEANWCQDFYVLTKAEGPSMPILGLTFLERTGAIVNLRTGELSLLWGAEEVHVPLFPPLREGSSMTIPARSQYHAMMPVTAQGTVMVIPQLLGPGVFVARTASKVNGGKTMTRILNTTQEDVTLHDVVMNTEPFEEGTAKGAKDSARWERLQPRLRTSHLTQTNREKVESLCTKYRDIFHVKGDPLSTTALMQHGIALKPGTQPVYTKPYRNPRH